MTEVYDAQRQYRVKIEDTILTLGNNYGYTIEFISKVIFPATLTSAQGKDKSYYLDRCRENMQRLDDQIAHDVQSVQTQNAQEEYQKKKAAEEAAANESSDSGITEESKT